MPKKEMGQAFWTGFPREEKIEAIKSVHDWLCEHEKLKTVLYCRRVVCLLCTLIRSFPLCTDICPHFPKFIWVWAGSHRGCSLSAFGYVLDGVWGHWCVAAAIGSQIELIPGTWV